MQREEIHHRHSIIMFSNLFTTLLLHRHLSTSTTTILPRLLKTPSKYKNLAVTQAQQALSDYLHATRCLPYPYADQIAKNSLLSLSNLIAKVGFSASDFSKNLDKFLRFLNLVTSYILELKTNL